MAAKRFRLSAVGKQMRTEAFRFRVGFRDGSRYCSQKKCPVITVSDTDVLATTDIWAQENLAVMRAAGRSRRNGKTHPVGQIWEDVTDATEEGDVTQDLDTVFDSVRG